MKQIKFDDYNNIRVTVQDFVVEELLNSHNSGAIERISDNVSKIAQAIGVLCEVLVDKETITFRDLLEIVDAKHKNVSLVDE
jgi:hypothetical protein